MADEMDTGQEPENGVVDDKQKTDAVVENNEGGADDNQEPLTVEALAGEMGWVPQDKFSGPADKWKPADEFIRAGREIQRNYADEVRGLRSQIDTIAKTSAQIAADAVERQRAELVEKFNAAVEDGNATEAHKISVDLSKLDAPPASSSPSPSSEGQAFAQRHASWFNKDTAATARAVQICNDLAGQGVSQADQLKAAERVIRAEYPEHFKNEQNGHQRSAPLVNQPGGRSAAPSNRAKGFSDMPKAAQDIAADMVERGVITKKEDYANYYWKNAEAKR